jgi:hypothetical protein
MNCTRSKSGLLLVLEVLPLHSHTHFLLPNVFINVIVPEVLLSRHGMSSPVASAATAGTSSIKLPEDTAKLFVADPVMAAGNLFETDLQLAQLEWSIIAASTQFSLSFFTVKSWTLFALWISYAPP